MKKNNILKRLSAAVLSAVLATGLLATSASAAAAGNLPDPNATSKLTVHKFATMGDSNLPGDGTAIDENDESKLGNPLAGAKFELYKIKDKVEVTGASTPEGFGAGDFEATYTGTTDAAGLIVWDSLPNGYYVLKETDVPAGYTNSASIPAIISLPFGYTTDSADGPTTEYNYDVHVYPKNISTSDINKVVNNEKAAYVVGDVINWEITAKLPGVMFIADPAAYGSVKITDPLDVRLTFDSAVVTLQGGTNGQVVLVKDVDYTEVEDPADSNIMVWTLTKAGLEKAQTEKATNISVQVDTKVNELAQTNQGTGIKNTAKVESENADGSKGPTDEIPEEKGPEVSVGGIIIDKVDVDANKVADAKFKIALTEKDAKEGTFLKDKDGNDIEVTTDADGYAQFMDFTGVAEPGIDWDSTDVKTFWLVETQAPTGFIKPSNPYKVEMKDEAGAAVKQFTMKITNYKPGDPVDPDDKNPIFTLPMTGGMGTVLFTVVGLVLMIGAVVILAKSNRKNA